MGKSHPPIRVDLCAWFGVQCNFSLFLYEESAVFRAGVLPGVWAGWWPGWESGSVPAPPRPGGSVSILGTRAQFSQSWPLGLFTVASHFQESQLSRETCRPHRSGTGVLLKSEWAGPRCFGRRWRVRGGADRQRLFSVWGAAWPCRSAVSSLWHWSFDLQIWGGGSKWTESKWTWWEQSLLIQRNFAACR